MAAMRWYWWKPRCTFSSSTEVCAFFGRYFGAAAGLLTSTAATPYKVGETLFLCLWGVFTLVSAD